MGKTGVTAAMGESFLISIDFSNPPLLQHHGLDLNNLSLIGKVLITAVPERLEEATLFVRQNCSSIAIYCDCTGLDDLEEIANLLNNGCARAIVTDVQSSSILDQKILQAEHLYRLIRTSEPNTDNPTFVRLDEVSIEDYQDVVKKGQVAVIPVDKVTASPSKYSRLFPLHKLITSVLISDRPDGLFPTVVSDERGICLGLVYSNTKSIEHALETGRGVYHSRSRNQIWVKGEESGDVQHLLRIRWDCDADALQFLVSQKGAGFCHLKRTTCFGPYNGLARLESTLLDRHRSAPPGSYTARLFQDPALLKSKILEEAEELSVASSKGDVAAEAADLLYFALTKCIASGVSIADVERNLDLKSTKITRRKGDAKSKWAQKIGLQTNDPGMSTLTNGTPSPETLKEAASVPKSSNGPSGFLDGRIRMRRFHVADTEESRINDALQRPSQRATDDIMNVVKPIVKDVQKRGDAAVLEYTHKFEKATSLTSPVIKAPFSPPMMEISSETKKAIDTSFDNIRRFHAAQSEAKPLQVETMPGVVCSRFSRPIERVGLYVPGGTAVLPSTALMLGVPAMVAGCRKIIIASPPRKDGTITPEIVYIANKIGAESILLAGGAQAVAALAYGTESVSKVDKILGPGNQFVTAGKMLVSNDTTAGVSIDMPAGPSEVLVIADKTSNPAFVAADLLSQAEHGPDSQVVLIAVDLDEQELTAIEDELHKQANALPRVDIVRGAIEHSVTLIVKSVDEAVSLSNAYAPEHLIIQTQHAASLVHKIQNAGSVFIGPWTPESVGDYSAGVNHSLPTYGYARQYSGVNLSSFTKHITSSELTRDGLQGISGAVMQLAEVEELQAHRRAVSIRLDHMSS